MDAVLLDTTIASFLRSSTDLGKRLRLLYAPFMKDKVLVISFQTIAELWMLAGNREWNEKHRADLADFIRRFIVIPYDYDLAKKWAQVMRASRDEKRGFEAGDCWIAATAVHRGLTLLAHDKHFAGRSIAGLNVVSFVDGPKAVH